MSNAKISKRGDAVLFAMPSLDEERCARELMNSAEEIQRRAYEEGFEAGERAGYSEGEQKAVILLERLGLMIQEIAEFKENLVDNLEPQLVSLAGSIAKKIIVEEVRTRPEVIVTMVREALKRLQRVGSITIRTNPALYDLFMNNKKELLDIHSDIVFDMNSNVPVTGPLVISDIEEVITDIESLLSNVMEEMKSEMKAGSKQKGPRKGTPAKKKGSDQQAEQ